MFVVHNLKLGLSMGFVHIPRTGGTSLFSTIETWAANNPQTVRIDPVAHHASLAKMPKSDIMTTIVRNPWDRMLSLYCLLQKHRDTDNYLFVVPTKIVDGKYPEFNEWMLNLEQYQFRQLNLPNFKFSHTPLTSQCDFIRDGHVDVIGRFENIAYDAQRILTMIGCDEPYKNENSTIHNHYSSYYNDESKAKIAHLFAEDIEKFGYKYEEAATNLSV